MEGIDHPQPGRAPSRPDWIRPVLQVIAAMVVIGAIAAACASDDAPSTSGPAQAGAALYAQNCASCHGADLGGTNNGPPHLSVVYEPNHHPDDAFRSAVQNGVTPHHWNFGAMPPIAGLEDNEVDSIIAFVRGEQERQGFEPYPP